MTRLDLDDSDLQGLGEPYRPFCAQRRWAAQQPLHHDIRKAKRLRARPAWVKPAIWIVVLAAAPFAWALVARLAGD